MSRKQCKDKSWMKGVAYCPFISIPCAKIIECPAFYDDDEEDDIRRSSHDIIVFKKHKVKVINDDTCSRACSYYSDNYCTLFNCSIDTDMTRCDDCKRASASFVRPLGSVDLLEVL